MTDEQIIELARQVAGMITIHANGEATYSFYEYQLKTFAKLVAQHEQGEPVGWISNKDFEPIRIRIMQEAYELADNNDPEGYNAIKVMCGDVQKMLSPQRTWVGTVDCIGLALDLEAQAKRVESQTVQRTMLAAANGLRIIDKESKT